MIRKESTFAAIGWDNNDELLEKAQQVYMMQLWKTHLMSSALGD